jgi:hypothetical protein
MRCKIFYKYTKDSFSEHAWRSLKTLKVIKEKHTRKFEVSDNCVTHSFKLFTLCIAQVLL